jgi:hypothetical protein
MDPVVCESASVLQEPLRFFAQSIGWTLSSSSTRSSGYSVKLELLPEATGFGRPTDRFDLYARQTTALNCRLG